MGTDLHLPWLCASPYSLEFRRDAVASYRRSGRPLAEVARDLGVPAESLRAWVKQAGIDPGGGEELTSKEREELRRLRRENRVLRDELELLRQAATSAGRASR
jgi:transposase